MKYILFTLLALAPLVTLAHELPPESAGTDEYLRHELSMTEEQLSTPLETEDREPFELASGAIDITDPIADVLTRYGITSSLHQSWGDIRAVSVVRNETAQMWDVRVTVAGEVPADPSYKIQTFLYADTNADASDNSAEGGVRGNVDAEFSIQHNAEKGWYTDYRWYNKEVEFWAVNKETAMTFSVEYNGFVFHIPFSEMPAETPLWRVVVAMSDTDVTQIDVAPGVGFPPAKGSTPSPIEEVETAQPWYKSMHWYDFLPWLIFYGILGYGIHVARRRKTEPRV